MIVTSHSEWVAVYNAIKEESRQSDEKHVFIYASASDVDSVAALRILERLLRHDMIPHGWLAVSRYQEVIDDFNKYYEEGDDNMRTAILINCGAAEDVRSLLNLYERANVRVVIIDSHRPICHMNNVDMATDNVVVFLDESEGCLKSDIPPAMKQRGEDSDDDEDDEDDPAAADDVDNNDDQDDLDNNRENLDGINAPAAQRRRLSSGGYVDPTSPPPPRVDRRRKRKELDRAIKRHYMEGCHHGKPAACILFDLAYHLQADTSHALWLALIGLTDQMVHSRISTTKYAEYCAVYENHLAQLGHFDIRGAAGVGGGYEDAEAGDAYVGASKSGRITVRKDFRFGLLWEWNLYEAMSCSTYVAARLHTYSEKGRQLLEMLIAKMGIPLQQAQGSYLHDMKPVFRKNLQEKLETHAPNFNMGDIMVRSFQLQDGPQRCVMAIDAVLAVAALLGCGSRTPSGGGGGTNDGTTASSTPVKDDHIDKFWRAYHALSWGQDQGELRKGLDLAKKIQRALVTDGGSVVAQRLYHNFKAFRVYDLSDHKLTSQDLLSHPMALQRLAAFFQEQHFQTSKKKKPVVLIGPKREDGRCLVVGYQATAHIRGNKLGLAFAEATEEVGAQAWHDLFEATVIELAASDVERFKQELLRAAAELL